MKILVLVTFRPDADGALLQQSRVGSSRALWDLYLNGIVREMYQREDQRGTVFVCEAPDVNTVRDALAQVPIVQTGQVVGEIIGLQAFADLPIAFAP